METLPAGIDSELPLTPGSTVPPPPPGMADFVREQTNERVYGSPTQQAIAALEGAARGVSLGLYDVAAPAFGVSSEASRLRRELNPATSMLSEIGGGAALVALTGGMGAAGEAAVFAPKTLQAADVAAQTAAAAGLTGAEIEAARKAAIYANTTLAQRLGASAASAGMEGAIFSAGSALSDYGLGDPDLTADKVATDIGLGAILGAGLGVAGQGIDEIFTATGKLKNSLVDKVNKEAEEIARDAGKTQAAWADEAIRRQSPSLRYRLDKKIPSEKRIQAAIDYDLPIIDTTFDDSPFKERALSVLLKDAPSAAQAVANEVVAKSHNATLERLFAAMPAVETNAYDAGTTVNNWMLNYFDNYYSSIRKVFDDTAPVFDTVQLTERQTQAIARNIMRMKQVRQTPGSPEARLATRVASDLLNAKNGSDINFHIKTVSNAMQSDNGSERYMAGKIYKKLIDAKHNSTKRYRERIIESLENEAPDKQALFLPVIQDLTAAIANDENARAAYADFMPKLQWIVKEFGLGEIDEPMQGLAALRDAKPERIMQKLTSPGNYKLRKEFQEIFPDVMPMIRDFEQSEAIRKASKSGKFDIRSFFKQQAEAKQKSPQMYASTWEPDQVKLIDGLRDYYEGIPRDWNPSGTASEYKWYEVFSDPRGFATANYRGFQLMRELDKYADLPEHLRPRAELVGQRLGEQYKIMEVTSRMADRVENSIVHGIASLRGVAVPAGAAVLTAPDDSSFEQKVEKIHELANDPEAMSATVDFNVDNLATVLPNVSQKFAASTIRAVQFLNSKIPAPKNAQQIDEWQPSDLQKQKFMRYYDAVNNPLKVFSQIKDGTLTKEAVEAMQAVRPSLYNYLRNQIELQVPTESIKRMNETQRRALSLFLGKPVSTNQLQPVRAANQAAYQMMNGQQAAQNNALMGNPTLNGMSKLKVGQREEPLTARKPNE